MSVSGYEFGIWIKILSDLVPFVVYILRLWCLCVRSLIHNIFFGLIRGKFVGPR